ncbi:hypothetical protein J4442_02555 [Candidatus Woesearchaeota archaeon]|nr:hypothetical protein [Candidatus Woesearchaeota archaeon]
MSDERIISERPITMVELSEDLDSLENKEKELSFRANKTKSYLKQFVKIKIKDAEELKKKIEGLDIPRIKERQIVKIIDMLPESLDELKMLMVGETTTITDENMKKILDVVKDYVKRK